MSVIGSASATIVAYTIFIDIPEKFWNPDMACGSDFRNTDGTTLMALDREGAGRNGESNQGEKSFDSAHLSLDIRGHRWFQGTKLQKRKIPTAEQQCFCMSSEPASRSRIRYILGHQPQAVEIITRPKSGGWSCIPSARVASSLPLHRCRVQSIGQECRCSGNRDRSTCCECASGEQREPRLQEDRSLRSRNRTGSGGDTRQGTRAAAASG